VEALARSVETSEGVVFVPALAGMGAPHWLPEARGILLGLTRRTTKAHVARATLEGIAFQVGELLEAMGRDCGKKLKRMQVDGGASEDALLMQFQSDLLGIPLQCSGIKEITGLGVGLQAGLGVGLWKSMNEIEKLLKTGETYRPRISGKARAELKTRWSAAIEALQVLYR
jgi:glycerol kinase